MATTSSIPSGCIMAFAGTAVPVGWLLCNGSQISRTTYVGLFNAVGTIHGAGNGTTTFHLPDYRGRFLRGRDGGIGNDPDRASRTASNTGGATGDNVGSVQLDENKAHSHTLAKHGGNLADGTGAHPSGPFIGSYTTSSTGGNESRPKNAYVNFIIKE